MANFPPYPSYDRRRVAPLGFPPVGHSIIFQVGGRACSGVVKEWGFDVGPDAHSDIDGEWVATVTGCRTLSEDGAEVALPDQGVAPYMVRSFFSFANCFIGWWEVVDTDGEGHFYARVPSHTPPHSPVKVSMVPHFSKSENIPPLRAYSGPSRSG